MLATRVPDAEVVVVNGPSSDGTTGMVCERDDVDVLLEIAERNVNVARNAGIVESSSDIVALLADTHRPEPGWADEIENAVTGNTGVVAGPAQRQGIDGKSPDDPERTTIARTTVCYFHGGNVAFTRDALSSIDGFDEYLQTGGARDAAHRLAACGQPVAWEPGMRVSRDVEPDGGSTIRADLPRPDATDGEVGNNWGWKYRSLTYRLVKNYGVRPTVARRVIGHLLSDARSGVERVADDDTRASACLAGGRTSSLNAGRGLKDGLRARFTDRSPRRNPNGVTSRTDRPVECYDWR